MTCRILHVGDVHLQSTHERNADRLASLRQITDHASQVDHLAAILIPGDLFHTRPTTQDRNDLADVLQGLARYAPVLLAQGNHDEPGSLDLYTRLKSQWPIYLATRPEVLLVPAVHTPTGIPIACFALPYPHKAGMVGAGVAPEALGQTTRSLFDPIFLSAAEELQAAVRDGALPVMMGHVSIGGAVSSTGQPQIGHELEIDPALLARLNQPAVGDLYCGLSHIHKHQAIGTGVYAGSIARLDFGEREPKGFVEIEYQRDGATWEHRWRFVPLDVPGMVHIEGELTPSGFRPDHDDWMCQACHGEGDGTESLPCEACVGTGHRSWSSVDVRVRYRFLKAEVDALDVAHIHAQFADARSLKLDPVPVLEHTVRAPEIQEAETLEAKVRAYAAHVGLPATDGLMAKVSALQAGDGASVLRYVTDGLPSVSVDDHDRQAVA